MRRAPTRPRDRGGPRHRVVSRSSTFRSRGRSGHHPAVSASAPGSVTPASASWIRAPRMRSAIAPTAARYSRASSSDRSVGSGSRTASASTHRPGALPGDADAHHSPVQAAQHDRTNAVGEVAGALDACHGADPRVAPVEARHEQEHALARGGRVGRRRGPRRSRARASRPSAAGRPRSRAATGATWRARRTGAGLGCGVGLGHGDLAWSSGGRRGWSRG